MSTRKADLPREQQSHYGEEDGQDKQDVGGAHYSIVGQLVGLASHLVDVKPYREYQCCHTEQHHFGGETKREREKI